MKQLIWMGSSHEDLKKFPRPVRSMMGHVLYTAQNGKMHDHVKVLRGMGNAKVLEIKENAISGTYRVVYTVEMKDFIFVLHAFQKKSKSGIATPKRDIDIIITRLKEAKIAFKNLMEKRK